MSITVNVPCDFPSTRGNILHFRSFYAQYEAHFAKHLDFTVILTAGFLRSAGLGEKWGLFWCTAEDKGFFVNNDRMTLKIDFWGENRLSYFSVAADFHFWTISGKYRGWAKKIDDFWGKGEKWGLFCGTAEDKSKSFAKCPLYRAQNHEKKSKKSYLKCAQYWAENLRK